MFTGTKRLYEQKIIEQGNRISELVRQGLAYGKEKERLTETIEAQKLELDNRQKTIWAYEKTFEFEYAEGRPILVVKLGDTAKGWIPGPDHAASIRKQLKDAGIDKKYNIILFNYALNIELVRE
jgi:hypothetical protein